MKKVRLIALFMVGALVGGVVVELVHRSSDQHSKLIFARRLKCQSLANAYLKNEGEFSKGLISAVDYSPSRNSCIASFKELQVFPGGVPKPTIEYSVRDLISQKLIWSTSCEGSQNCEDIKWLQQTNADWDAAYQKAMAGRD